MLKLSTDPVNPTPNPTEDPATGEAKTKQVDELLIIASLSARQAVEARLIGNRLLAESAKPSIALPGTQMTLSQAKSQQAQQLSVVAQNSFSQFLAVAREIIALTGE